MAVFSVAAEVKDGIAVVSISGFFDADAARATEAEIRRVATSGQTTRFVLSLADVQTISDPGMTGLRDLAALIDADLKGRLALVCRDKVQRRAIERGGVLLHGEAASSLPEAINLLG